MRWWFCDTIGGISYVHSYAEREYCFSSRDTCSEDWRKWQNNYFHKFRSSPVISRLIKWRRMGWAGYVVHTGVKKGGMGGVCYTRGREVGGAWYTHGREGGRVGRVMLYTWERWGWHDMHMGENEDEMGVIWYTHGREEGRDWRGKIYTWEGMRTRWPGNVIIHMGEVGGAWYTHGTEEGRDGRSVLYTWERDGQGILYTCNWRKVKWVWHVVHIWEKEDEMGWARYTLGKDETCVQNFSKSLGT
jgi:hypothetical protein